MRLDDRLIALARAQRVQIEAELGARSFREFVRLAWSIVEPEAFVPNWHIDLICDHMQRIARREIRNLVICIPPRHSKSLLISVLFPAWVWTWFPGAKFITASYDLRLAHRDALKTRILVESPWYRDRWPQTQLLADQNQKGYYRTTVGGHRWSCSPSSGVMGEGADFILCDDLHTTKKAESDADRETVRSFLFEALPSRLNNPKTGVKMVIQQRLHEQDAAGLCIKEGWPHVVLPAQFEADHPQRHPADPRTEEGEVLNPHRFDRDDVLRLASDMGEYAAAGQLQQRPIPRAGGLFKAHLLGVAEAAPADCVWVRSWDLASTEKKLQKSDPDWTVGVLMGRSRSSGGFYVKDRVKLRGGPDEVEKTLRATAERDGKRVRIRVPIDPGQAGKAMHHHIVKRVLPGWPVSGEAETGDKFTRALPFAAQIEAGNVWLLPGTWHDDFIRTLQMFPAGSHDDDVDAASGAFRSLMDNSTGMLEFYASQYAEREAAKEAEKAKSKPET